jgi:uncharacterized protein YdaU (DUF1376 family)
VWCLNFYKRHLGDYAKDAGHLSMLEHGAYTMLLDRYYTNEAPIPKADAYRVTHARSSAEKTAVDSVLREFFVLDGQVYRQKRADQEIELANYKRSIGATLGKLGGRPKKTQTLSETVSETETLREPFNKPSQTPDSRLQTNTEEPTVLVAPGRPPACPSEALVALYHEHLPMLPRVEVLNDPRRRALSARWREVVTDPDIRKAEDVRAAGLDWFAWYFSHAAKSRFLTGRAKEWRADLDFLLLPKKFAKVVEGSYHREAA